MNESGIQQRCVLRSVYMKALKISGRGAVYTRRFMDKEAEYAKVGDLPRACFDKSNLEVVFR